MLFADEVRSKIIGLRMVSRGRLGVHMAFYAVCMLVWTVSFSTAISVHGESTLFLQSTPHISLFAIVLGIVVFPMRIVWYPLVVFCGLYGISLLFPFMQTADAPDLGVLLRLHLLNLTVNLAVGLFAGLGGRWLHLFLMGRTDPISADLALIGVNFAVVVPMCMVMMITLSTLGPAVVGPWWGQSGFSEMSWTEVFFRGLRASFVSSMAMILAVEAPRRRHFRRALMFLPVFGAMIWMYYAGFYIAPIVEMTLLLTFLAAVLSVNLAPIVVFGGAAAYSLTTGVFIYPVSDDPEFGLLSEAMSAALTFILFAILLNKTRLRFEADIQRLTVERLENVRDFADIGRFTVNLKRGRMVLDDAASRILDFPHVVDLHRVSSRLRPEDSDKIEEALSNVGVDLNEFTLHFRRGGTAPPDPNDVEGTALIKVYIAYELRKGRRAMAYGFLIDITSEWRKEVALQDALDRLNEKQERQKELFSIISHELRTPASIIAMLIERMDLDPDWSEVSPKINEASEQLLATLGDMRQAVYPERNLPVRMQPMAPANMMERVMNSFDQMARDHNVRLSVDLGDGAHDICMIEVNRVRAALSNLLRNALLHSTAQNVIIAYEAQYTEKGRVGQWSVIDNGQGIPPEDVEKIFEPFRRLSNGTKRVDGSGLGLYIVKSAIELLGGKVWHCDSPSGGAQFTFTLPESLAKGVVAPARPALDVRPAMPTPTPSNDVAPPKPAASEPAKTVVDGCALVVEDSEIIREIMAAVLRQHFSKVIVANDGVEGLKMVDDHTPDIILTDLFMPNMAGDEMIAKLRPDFPTLPIIGVTAAVVGEEARRFEVAGADRVLAKPLRTENIAEIVEQYFGAGPSRATRA